MDKDALFNRYFKITDEALKMSEYHAKKSALVADVGKLDDCVAGFNNMLNEYLSLRSSLSVGLGFVTDKTFRDKMVELRNVLMNMGMLANKIRDGIYYMRNTFGEITDVWIVECEQKTHSLVFDAMIKTINNLDIYIGSYIEFLNGYKPASVVTEDNRAALHAEDENRKKELREKAQDEFLKQIRIKRKK